MSFALIMRALLALFAAGFGAFLIYYSDRQERIVTPVCDENSAASPRYMACFAAAGALPLLIGALLGASMVQFDIRTAFLQVSSFCFDIFLHISIYYLFLTLFLPFLRRHFSARVCAVLWLLPNYLYFTQLNFMQMDHPLLILHLPVKYRTVFFAFWAIGSILVLSTSFVSHLLFRYKTLHQAHPVTEDCILDCWQRELAHAGVPNAKYKLMICDTASTPFSIGFFESTIRVVLPNRSYTSQELSLILRHELVHIGRGDCKTKFFLIFCTAMCWFNPLMWFAMHRSAEDLELSCDETVLLNASPSDRRLYAELLLRTAGEQRGFTTCLSSSACSLRYRLHNVMQPNKRMLGAVLTGVIFFILIISCGAITFAFDSGSVQEIIFKNRSLEEYSIQSIYLEDSSFCDCKDESAFLTSLASLKLDKIGSSYRFPTQQHKAVIVLDGPDGIVGLSLNDSSLLVTHFYKEPILQEKYVLNGSPDWKYLYSLLGSKSNA